MSRLISLGTCLGVLILAAAQNVFATGITGEDLRRCEDAVKAVRQESGFTIHAKDVKGLYTVARPDRADREGFSARLFGDLLSRVAESFSIGYRYEVVVDSGKRRMLWRPKDGRGRMVGPSRTIGAEEYALTLADLRAHLPQYCAWLEMKSMGRLPAGGWKMPETVRTIVERGPTSPALYFEIAMAYKAAGDVNQAATWLEKAKSASRDPRALYEGLSTFASDTRAVEELRANLAFPVELVVVAASTSQTGRFGVAGKALTEGYLWWKEDVNRRGGILGRVVELRLLDDRSEQAEVEKAYLRWTRDEKVAFVLGPLSTPFTIAAGKIADAYGYPLVASAALPGGLLRAGLKNVFAVSPSEAAFWESVVAVGKERGTLKFALVHSESIFYADIAQFGTEYIKRRGGEVLYFDKFPTRTLDFDPYLEKLRSVHGATPVIVGEPGAMALFLRQGKEKGLAPQHVIMVTYPSLDAVAGSFPLPAVATSTWEAHPGLPNPGIAEFITRYREMWGRPPDHVAAAAVGAAQVLEAAIRLAGSFDRGNVIEALRKLETQTVFGGYRYDAKALQAANRPLLVRWSETGKKTILWPKGIGAE